MRGHRNLPEISAMWDVVTWMLKVIDYSFSKFEFMGSLIFLDEFIIIKKKKIEFMGIGLTEALFLEHKDIYLECEKASMKQHYKAKVFLKHLSGSLSLRHE